MHANTCTQTFLSDKIFISRTVLCIAIWKCKVQCKKENRRDRFHNICAAATDSQRESRNKLHQENLMCRFIPVCLLRRCVMRGAGEEEEPFPRGKKRAAPLTVRKFSLILMTRTVTDREKAEIYYTYAKTEKAN